MPEASPTIHTRGNIWLQKTLLFNRKPYEPYRKHLWSSHSLPPHAQVVGSPSSHTLSLRGRHPPPHAQVVGSPPPTHTLRLWGRLPPTCSVCGVASHPPTRSGCEIASSHTLKLWGRLHLHEHTQFVGSPASPHTLRLWSRLPPTGSVCGVSSRWRKIRRSHRQAHMHV